MGKLAAQEREAGPTDWELILLELVKYTKDILHPPKSIYGHEVKKNDIGQLILSPRFNPALVTWLNEEFASRVGERGKVLQGKDTTTFDPYLPSQVLSEEKMRHTNQRNRQRARQ